MTHVLRALAVLALASPLTSLLEAQGAAEFRSSAELTLASTDALHRFTLPVQAYRDARRDLGDLRVLNAKGESVPFALVGDAPHPRDTVRHVPLRFFPVYAPTGRPLTTEVGVSVRTRTDGTVISVQSQPGAPRSPRPTAWLLDASAIDAPIRALELDWEGGPGTEVMYVSLYSSEDLRRWLGRESHLAVVRAAKGTDTLAQRRVEFGPYRVPYWRLVPESPEFQLRGVVAELLVLAPPVERTAQQVRGVPGAKAGEYTFDLGARLPVEVVRVVLPAENTAAPMTLLARDSERDEWRPVTSGTVSRITRDGRDIQTPASRIATRTDRYWLLRVDERSGGLGAEPPSLEVAWRPAQVVFVARGEGPFRVAFGHPDAPRAALDVASLIPGYEKDAEHALPVAQVGVVTSVELRGDGLRRLFGEDGGRRLALWAVLIGGVLVLGYMAWRLTRQMQGAPPTDG